MFTNKFPCYTQLNNMDCGPTCLKMICSFYGIKQDVELIRDLCCFSKTGVSLLALQHAAEKLGFESIGVKCKLEELNEMPLPCILHWNQGHYVVLYKIQKRGNDFVFLCQTLLDIDSLILPKNFQIAGYLLMIKVSFCAWNPMLIPEMIFR